jgi:hypothetical protein
MAHFEDLVDRLFFDDLLLGSSVLGHFDPMLRILQASIES